MVLTKKQAHKIFDAKLTICSYCKMKFPLFDDGKCDKCILNIILKKEKIDYETYDDDFISEDIENIKFLHPLKDKWWFEDHPLYNVSGIYGIYVDCNIVYVGQSKYLYQRWVCHAYNTCGVSRDNYRKIYMELRKKYNDGSKIYFRVLEFCEVKKLETREKYWIYKLNPALNKLVPKKLNSNENKAKKVRSI